jgi:hypothetical protein
MHRIMLCIAPCFRYWDGPVRLTLCYAARQEPEAGYAGT